MLLTLTMQLTNESGDSRNPMIVTTMKLIQAGEAKILAGHQADADPPTVLMLRRDGDDYVLRRIEVGDREQLRSFVSADQIAANELVAAVDAPFENALSAAPRSSRCSVV
jgi:hypothetical protein